LHTPAFRTTAPDARLSVLESRELGSSASAGRGSAWAGAITFAVHGAVVGIRSTDSTVLERISAAPPTGAELCYAPDADAVYSWTVERAASARPVHVISMRCRRYMKSKDIARTTDVDKAIAILSHDAEFRVAMYAPDDVFIHAAVVSWHGRAILIPGHSFAGKSTLAAELVRQGAPYLSDEYAVLGRDGLVRPFARHLLLRGETGRSIDRRSAEELGGTRGGEPLLAGCVLLTSYAAGAGWHPQPMSRGEMVLALLRHAIDVQARPTHVLERIVRVLGRDVVGLQGDRGEAAVTAREILDCLAKRSASASALSRSA
jgi:hypothetical protein